MASTSTPAVSSETSTLPPPLAATLACNFGGCDQKGDKRCSACKSVGYCSADHQKKDWSKHKSSCKPIPKVALKPGFLANAPSGPKSARAIKSYCQGEVIPEEWNKPRETFQYLTVPGNDPIFSTEPMEITKLFGFPILMRRVSEGLDGNDLSFANPQARALGMDPLTGDAKPEWKKGVGSIIVARADRLPLSEYQFEAAWKFAASLMDLYSFSRGRTIPKVVKEKLSREAFEEYYKTLRKENVREYKWERSPKTLEGEEIKLEGREEVNKLDGEFNSEKEGYTQYKKDGNSSWKPTH